MDDLARQYVLLALAAGTHYEGIVDAYYGPSELRAEAQARAGTPATIAVAAATLRERLTGAVEPQRRRWLHRQLVALETIMRRLAGDELDYLEEVELCFDARPERTPEHVYDEAHRLLDELLPAGPSLRERVEALNLRLTVPVAQLEPVLDWLVDEIRTDCARHFPLPVGEALAVRLVTDQPWSGYNWYDGDMRSRVEINTDLPVQAPSLIALITHECFPGHHLEHAWKEQRLYREQGRGEVSVQLINTPEAYISEGLAEVGGRLIVDRQRWQELFVGICERAGIELGPGLAERAYDISQALHALRGSGGDASLMLHADGRPRDEVRRFVERRALRTRGQAEKTLEFISHPLWRTYVFCYAGGERLLSQWCASAGDAETQRERFLRLLTEQLTPSEIAQDLADAA
ncbi:MAG TPA: hypothetical protein VNT28_05805 [Candidatus Limnocylindrales bacterium]|jgi:hypothetical protein|nr:hypothetical protein [Candidatus Limnocylindrales bacterium]